MNAPPDVAQHIFFLRLPDLGVVQFDDGQVNVHAVPERTVFARAVFGLLRFHAFGSKHQATDAHNGHAPEDRALRTAAITDEPIEEETPGPGEAGENFLALTLFLRAENMLAWRGYPRRR